MRYIALLRGINVGGNNKVSMPDLIAAFVQWGFTDVVTYINSGNVLFSAPLTDIMTLQEKCRNLIEEAFQICIPVGVISAEELIAAVDHAPSWWNIDPSAKHNAIFVIPPATAESIAKEVGEIKPEYERAEAYGSVVFWSAALATFSRTRWSKVVGTSAYGSITIRNANTTLKLAALAKESSLP